MPTMCHRCGGQLEHDHSKCASFLRGAYEGLGFDVTVSTAPPIVQGPFTMEPYVCPHGVAHWVEPTGEQLARWTAERA